MNRKAILGPVLLGWLLSSCAQQLKVNAIFNDAAKQTEYLLKNIPDAKRTNPDQVMPRTVEAGELKMVASHDWTSGFFPGILWYLFEYSGEQKWKEQAQVFTNYMEKEKTNPGTHDMGFKIFCSVGNANRLAASEHYKKIIIESARTLGTRFNKTVGLTRSWDMFKDKWMFPVIIDNMMNLELLFAATNLSGDSSFYRMAVTHANTTLQNHFRPDNSSYHVLSYDTSTGKIMYKQTHQGYANESAWARGQSWGLYGFTMCYRFTRDSRYLQQAEKIADFILKHSTLPGDKVPYWDFNAPAIPNEERDASAAAIMASALYELAMYSKSGKEYNKKATQILGSLTDHYRSPIGDTKGFILLHSVGHKPAKSEIDVPIIYADYYYLEALLRYKRLKEGKPVVPKL
jgi:unsaturated chondroitin disaccharide hydrolase